jgi:hypothetical protein
VLRGDAEACGALDELGRWLAYRDPRDGTDTRHRPRKRGLLGRALFVPSDEMRRFREKAKAAGAEQRASAFLGLPAYDQWFRDWATPRQWNGERRLLPLGGEEAHARPQRAAENRTTREPLSPQRYPVDDGHTERLERIAESSRQTAEGIAKLVEL